MHHLSELLPLKRQLDSAVESGHLSKAAGLRTKFSGACTAVESALEKWSPQLPPDSLGTVAESTYLRSVVANAMAYRHSAFVYLYRTIHAYPRGHAQVQSHSQRGLLHCVDAISHAGPMGALLWPLFVSACEAVHDEDREQARRAFDALDKHQGMTNIGRAWEIVQEVWRRADILDGENVREGGDLCREACRDLGMDIVFG